MRNILTLLFFSVLLLTAFNLDAQTLVADTIYTPTEELLIPETTGQADTSNLLLAKERQTPVTATTIFRGFLGVLILLGFGFLLSTNRSRIPWKTVGVGLALQVMLALGVLYIPAVQVVFNFLGKLFVKVLDFTREGSQFLLGGLLDANTYGYIFMFQVLPTIIFFSAITSLLFYWGVIQKIVSVLAWIFSRLMKLSGAEALAVAGNIFLGQSESPLLIKPYLSKMNSSELLLVMAGGMATMAGGVLAAYIAMLGGDDPQMRLEFAKHLLTASVMAAPGAIIFSKMIIPPSDEVDRVIEVSREKVGDNILDAITNGTSEGVKLAVNVAAMLLAFIAFIAMFNFSVGKIGQWTGLNELIASGTGGRYTELSLQFLLGYTFAPLMWLIGISSHDMILVGRLLGEKIILTEFIGYISLTELKASGIFAETKSIIMATYVLCGFANFASIGILIGAVGALAPNQRVLLSRLGLRAMIAGTLASLMSATIVGMILG